MEQNIHNSRSLIQNSNGLYQDACTIIEQAQAMAYRAVNEVLIKRNWLLGMRIQREVLKEKRAEYGEQVVKGLAKELTRRFGSGYSRNNLYRCVSFYKAFPEIFHSASGKYVRLSSDGILQSLIAQFVDGDTIVPAVAGQSEKVPAVTGQFEQHDIYSLIISEKPLRLSWSHYAIILQEDSKEARAWYEQEAANEMWSTRTLQRNISSQYYHRLLQSQNKELVRDEMKRLTQPLQDRLEYLKNPVVAEFLGFKNNTDYTESDLEQRIIDHMIPFLMELGKGFALVDRQKRIHTEKEDYYIDLVFYNYNLYCFVLIDLKTTKLRHQDVGQMDMYVKMYDEMMIPQGHNPTIGILLCADTDEDVAHYSVLNGNDQLFAAKYLTYMPTKEELRREIEQQKEFFRLQNS
ncbi:MAG: PDDEXK nuclease domain-containing protein [Bacteroidales bacterium]|nr:PDDEXK nuclease domain-containing protein [Bacteroidales bacterium]